MRLRLSNAAILLSISLIAAAIAGLIHSVLGDGRSWGAYGLGALAFLVCFTVIVLAVAAIGWIIDHFASWLKRL
jgi:hypothetical protein